VKFKKKKRPEGVGWLPKLDLTASTLGGGGAMAMQVPQEEKARRRSMVPVVFLIL
jgi:hypothetical protein